MTPLAQPSPDQEVEVFTQKRHTAQRREGHSMDASKEENSTKKRRHHRSDRDKAFAMAPQPRARQWPRPVCSASYHHCHPVMRSQLHASWPLLAQPPATPSIPRPHPPTPGTLQLPHADTRRLHSLKPLPSTHSDLGALDPTPTSSDPGEEAMDLRGGGRSEPPSPSFMVSWPPQTMLLPCHHTTATPL
jgi:hypothetical protein